MEMSMKDSKPATFDVNQYCGSLGLPIKELTLLTIQRMYFHTYCIWNAYRSIDGIDPVKLYADFWKMDVGKSFSAVLKQLKIEQVPTIKELGEIVAYITSCAPSLYITKTNHEKLHISYVTWCGNPGILKSGLTPLSCTDHDTVIRVS
jgi:hypothetical protein